MFTYPHRVLRTLRWRGRLRVVRPGERSGSGRFPSLLLLTILFVLNGFDLALTQSQIPRGNFNELNVFAAGVIDSSAATAAYKIVLFGGGAAVLFRFRRHAWTQRGLVLLTGCYAFLMAWWVEYLHNVEICLTDPASQALLGRL